MLSIVQGLVRALLGAVLLGALNTLGDFVWAGYVDAHRAVLGLLHGAALCLALGGYLGALRGRMPRGAVLGAAIGALAAASFYALAPLMGYAAMFPAWMALWIGFALADARALDAPARGWQEAIVRGVLAALGSGAAFYAISGIWTDPRPGGPELVRHFPRWCLAFLPGFLGLLATRRGG
jgi:hypothetical protein